VFNINYLHFYFSHLSLLWKV